MESVVPVSVIVVSWERPNSLALTLLALGQLYYPNFEIVVVADKASLATLEPRSGLRLVPIDTPNISHARNVGIESSGGEIVAFIDDDAVPEPTWLDYLVAPIADRRAQMSGGFVRGRNGISFQWKARKIDDNGQPIDIELSEETIFPPQPMGAVKTEGTNMAILRDAVIGLGGFNEAYRFFLDETDLNVRANAQGLHVAICPDAQVHHGYAQSARRRADRAPRSLFENGVSVGVFAREHCSEPRKAIELFREQHRKWLLKMMVSGHIEPRDVQKLLQTFDVGIDESRGRSNAFGRFVEKGEFERFPTKDGNSVSLKGHWIKAIGLVRRARRLAVAGDRVSLFLFSFGTRFHVVRFVKSGYWLQHGGLLGKSERSHGLVRFSTLGARFEHEEKRVTKYRSRSAKK